MDNVNNPAHYNKGKYEVIDIIESIVNSMDLTPFQGVCLGNAIKYLARFKNKNGAEDLRKAKWYIDKLISTLE
jgi:hypothetical protein